MGNLDNVKAFKVYKVPVRGLSRCIKLPLKLVSSSLVAYPFPKWGYLWAES
jgi:hypothetical protein